MGQLITLYFDGSCEPKNPGGIATYGYAIIGQAIDVRGSGVIGDGDGMTNNVAEYTALIVGLEKLKEMNLNMHVEIKGDSQLAIKQLRGEWRVNAPAIIQLYAKAVSMIKSISATLTWIPREENVIADELSHKAFVEYCKHKKYDYRPCRCGGTLILRNGKNGKFYGCSRFPKCKNTEAIK